MPSKAHNKITYPFSNFNSATVEVCRWISNFISHLYQMWLLTRTDIRSNANTNKNTAYHIQILKMLIDQRTLLEFGITPVLSLLSEFCCKKEKPWAYKCTCRIRHVHPNRLFDWWCRITMTSWWRDGVQNHQPHRCLLNRLFRRRSRKTSKLRVTGLCAGNSPVTGEFPAQMGSNAENVFIWWRHHGTSFSAQTTYMI